MEGKHIGAMTSKWYDVILSQQRLSLPPYYILTHINQNYLINILFD